MSGVPETRGFPIEKWEQLQRQILDERGSEALRHGDPQGEGPLRRAKATLAAAEALTTDDDPHDPIHAIREAALGEVTAGFATLLAYAKSWAVCCRIAVVDLSRAFDTEVRRWSSDTWTTRRSSAHRSSAPVRDTRCPSKMPMSQKRTGLVTERQGVCANLGMSR